MARSMRHPRAAGAWSGRRPIHDRRFRRGAGAVAAAVVLGGALSGLAVGPAVADPGKVTGSTAPDAAPELPRGDSTDRIGTVGSEREALHYRLTRAPGEPVVLGVMGGPGSGEGYLRVETSTPSGLDCAGVSISPSHGRGAGAVEPFGDCRNDTEVIVSISRGSTGASEHDLLLRYQAVPVPVNQVPDSLPEPDLNPSAPTDPATAEPGESPWAASELSGKGGVRGTLEPSRPAWFRVHVGWGQQLNTTLFAAKDGGTDEPRVAMTVYDPALNTLAESRSRLSETGTGRTTKPVLVKNFDSDESEPLPYLAGDYLVALNATPDEDEPAKPADYVLSTSVLGEVTGVPITAEQQAAAAAKKTRQRVAIGLAGAGAICLAASVVLFVRRR